MRRGIGYYLHTCRPRSDIGSNSPTYLMQCVCVCEKEFLSERTKYSRVQVSVARGDGKFFFFPNGGCLMQGCING